MKKFTATLLPLCVLAGAANAQTWSTPNGSTDTAGETVDAKAVFTVDAGAGDILINLSNLLTAAQMMSVGQDVTDLSFTLSGSGFTSSSISTTSPDQDQLIDVGAGGVVTLVEPTTNQLGWGLTGSNGSYELDDLGYAGPANTLIGGTAGSTTAYSNAKGSIDDNGPHNPFIQGEADWKIEISGLKSTTYVSGATFSFGTTSGDDIVGTPEPSTIVLMVAGVALLARRRAKSRV